MPTQLQVLPDLRRSSICRVRITASIEQRVLDSARSAIWTGHWRYEYLAHPPKAPSRRILPIVMAFATLKIRRSMRWVLSTYNLTDFSSFDASDGSGPPLEVILGRERTNYLKCYTNMQGYPMGNL